MRLEMAGKWREKGVAVETTTGSGSAVMLAVVVAPRVHGGATIAHPLPMVEVG